MFMVRVDDGLEELRYGRVDKNMHRFLLPEIQETKEIWDPETDCWPEIKDDEPPTKTVKTKPPVKCTTGADATL